MLQAVASWELIADVTRLIAARVTAYHYQAHLHDTYTIGIMRRGVMSFYSRGILHRALPGDVFVVHPYEVHSGGDEHNGVEYDVLYPTVDLMAEAANVKRSNKEFPYFHSIVFEKSKKTLALSNSLDEYLTLDNVKQSQANLESCLENLFVGSSCSMQITALADGRANAIHNACELIQDTFNNQVALKDLHEKVGLSRFHFIRAFHQATGLTPNAFQRQVRLAEARNLIRIGEPLADVSQQTGFADQAHLSREFKKVYGITPGKFRRAIQQTASH